MACRLCEGIKEYLGRRHEATCTYKVSEVEREYSKVAQDGGRGRIISLVVLIHTFSWASLVLSRRYVESINMSR